MKNYTEYTAPEGYYYHKDDVYARALILPNSLSIDDYELVDEEAYQAFLKEEENKNLISYE